MSKTNTNDFTSNDLANDDVGIFDDELIRIPPGIYVAECVRVGQISEKNPTWTFRKRTLTYLIKRGDYAGISLPRYYNIPKQGRFTRNHAYSKDWIIANGGPPKRGDRMPASVFKQKLFEIAVRDSLDASGRITSSVVEHIIRVISLNSSEANTLNPLSLPITYLIPRK